MEFVFGYLLDEHMPLALIECLSLDYPTLRVFRIHDGTAPPNGTPDPQLLAWCEEHECGLVTINRRSMPEHLADHLRAGRHVPGIFTVTKPMTIKELAYELAVIAACSFPGEHTDQFRYLPIR
jgi:hypothetical protein